MSKMNFDRNNKEGFFARRGFYIALAICLVAVGAATWTAVNSVLTSNDATMNEPTSSYVSTSSSQSSSTYSPTLDVNNLLSDIPVAGSQPSVSSDISGSERSSSSSSTKSSVSTSSVPSSSGASGYSSTTSSTSSVAGSSSTKSTTSSASGTSSASSTDSALPKNDKVVASYYNMPVTGQVIKNYSDEQLQFSKTYNDWRIHQGIDIAAEKGTSVKAAGDGMVVKIYDDPSYGHVVVLDHGNNTQSYYSSIVKPVVKVGDVVKIGQNLGALESVKSESLDPPHLHFAMKKDGEFVNPLQIMGMAQ